MINASINESAIYKIIANGIPAIPKRMSEIREIAITEYLNMFFEKEKSLNFNAISGSSATSKYDMTIPIPTKKAGLDKSPSKKVDFSARKGSVLIKSALAGVGTRTHRPG